jgi:rhomboid protease GluP
MNEYFIKLPLRLWWITALIISANCLYFLIMVLNGVSITAPSSLDLIHWGANFAPLIWDNEPWRLFSSVFIHIGIVHLLVNMWALYLFGLYAEFYYSRWLYSSIYVIAGIAGGLASNYVNLLDAQQFLQQPSGQFPFSVNAGASGAIMGIGGALLVAALWPKAQLATQYRLNKNALLILMAINLGYGFIVEGINNAAHFGGLVAGVILALGYHLSLRLTTATQWQTDMQMIMCVVAGLACYTFYDYLLMSAQSMLPLWSSLLSSQGLG